MIVNIGSLVSLIDILLNQSFCCRQDMKLLESTEENIQLAANVVRNGGIVIYPTETVYGLGCDPGDKDATQKICEIKGRADKPLPLICANMEAAHRIVEFNPVAERLANVFWPGPLMLVLPSKMKYGMWVTHGSSTLGVRISDHPVASRLTKLSGGVLVSTSANISGKEPALTAQEALEQVGQQVNIILDGGPSQRTESSTVLDVSTEELWLLRKGPVTAEQIKEALKNLQMPTDLN